eukprot:Lithocolla_globosa_v1_NODE_4265_length_1476_cov_4.821253.p1 type:complete len:292 gc:universal NODE_4265_length_1476_cov_4.821253:578-1453(+)
MQRIWCLFEIYTALQCNAPLMITLGQYQESSQQNEEEEGKAPQQLLTYKRHDDVKSLVDILMATEVREAKATVEKDRKNILAEIKKSEGGFDEMNTRVRTALYNSWRIAGNPAIHAAVYDNTQRLRELIEADNGRGVTHPETKEVFGDPGGTILHSIAHGGYTKATKRALEAGVSPDCKTANGNTALMFAAEGNHVGVVRELILAECDLNLQNERGQTALMLAVKSNRHACAKLLIDAGANIDIQNQHGDTAVSMARLNKSDDTLLKLVEPEKEKNTSDQKKTSQRKCVVS